MREVFIEKLLCWLYEVERTARQVLVRYLPKKTEIRSCPRAT